MVYLVIIMLLAAADQGIKFLINSRIGLDEQIPVIDSFFYLVNRRNSGAAWSFLANKEWGIYVLAAVSFSVSIIMLVILYRSTNTRLKACLAVIIGGSIGNLIDRVRLLSVTDYLDFHLGSYIFPTFNLADMLVVCGTAFLCLLLLSDPSLLDRQAGKPADESNPAPPVEVNNP